MLDNLAKFSDAQAITTDTASESKVYLMEHTGRGEPVNVHIQVVEDFNNLTSLTVQVRQCATEGGTYTAVDNGISLVAADLKAGYKIPLRFLPQVGMNYAELYYDVNGTAPTTGKISAFIVEGEDLPVEDGLYISPRNPTGSKATA